MITLYSYFELTTCTLVSKLLCHSQVVVMAEVSPVASVAQVAGADIQLSTTIYLRSGDVAAADRITKDICKEICLANCVTRQLGTCSGKKKPKKSSLRTLWIPQNLRMKECSKVFAGIETTPDKSKDHLQGQLFMQVSKSAPASLEAAAVRKAQ